MSDSRSKRDGEHLGCVWYLAPSVWSAAALGSVAGVVQVASFPDDPLDRLTEGRRYGRANNIGPTPICNAARVAAQPATRAATRGSQDAANVTCGQKRAVQYQSLSQTHEHGQLLL